MTSLTERTQLIAMVEESLNAGARLSTACDIIDLAPRSYQRWKNDMLSDAPAGDLRPARIQTPRNALTPEERQEILSIANSDDYAALSPSQIVPRLADKGCYIASESSFYRVLRTEKQLAHRGKDRARTVRSKPRALCATAPQQLFSWDITYLPTEVKGVYFYLYLFIDIFSRKVVGWQIYDCESSELAAEVMRDICQRENIKQGQVVLHSDNGAPMKGATMLATLQALGVVPSFSRPAVSNDNCYSESWFRTLKYNAHYPQKPFGNLLEARTWVGGFISWYNNEHRHSAISFVTPNERHERVDIHLLEQRRVVYRAAKLRHPERWSGPIRAWKYIDQVHLNPDQKLANKEADIELKKAA